MVTELELRRRTVSQLPALQRTQQVISEMPKQGQRELEQLKGAEKEQAEWQLAFELADRPISPYQLEPSLKQKVLEIHAGKSEARQAQVAAAEKVAKESGGKYEPVISGGQVTGFRDVERGVSVGIGQLGAYHEKQYKAALKQAEQQQITTERQLRGGSGAATFEVPTQQQLRQPIIEQPKPTIAGKIKETFKTSVSSVAGVVEKTLPVNWLYGGKLAPKPTTSAVVQTLPSGNRALVAAPEEPVQNIFALGGRKAAGEIAWAAGYGTPARSAFFALDIADVGEQLTRPEDRKLILQWAKENPVKAGLFVGSVAYGTGKLGYKGYKLMTTPYVEQQVISPIVSQPESFVRRTGVRKAVETPEGKIGYFETYKVSGKAFTSTPGRVTRVTTRFRNIFGGRDIYSGIPYADKAGYQEAVSFISKRYKISTAKAKEMIRYVKPKAQQITYKGKGLLTYGGGTEPVATFRIFQETRPFPKTPYSVKTPKGFYPVRTTGKTFSEFVKGTTRVQSQAEEGAILKSLVRAEKVFKTKEGGMFTPVKLAGKNKQALEVITFLKSKKEAPRFSIFTGTEAIKKVVPMGRKASAFDIGKVYLAKGEPRVDIFYEAPFRVFKKTKIPKPKITGKPGSQLITLKTRSVSKPLKTVLEPPKEILAPPVILKSNNVPSKITAIESPIATKQTVALPKQLPFVQTKETKIQVLEKPAQVERFAVLPKVSQRELQREAQAQKTKQVTIQKSPQLSIVSPVQRMKQPQRETQKQPQIEITIPVQVFKTPQITKTPTRITTPPFKKLTPPPTTFVPLSPRGSAPKLFTPEERKKLIKGYALLLKRKGKYTQIGKLLPKGEAIKLGERLARQTLAATFKVTPTRQMIRGIESEYLPSLQAFRGYKIVRGRRVPLSLEWIQKRGKRLSARSEVAEIMRTKKQKGGSKVRWL